MQRFVGLVLATLLLPVSPAFGQPLAGAKPAFQELSYEQAIGTARRHDNKIVMIDFGATWCGPCKLLEWTTFKDAEVEKFLSNKLIAIKIDIDKHPTLAAKHNVTGVPTILFLDGDGKEVKRIVGYRTAGQFMQAVRRINKV